MKTTGKMMITSEIDLSTIDLVEHYLPNDKKELMNKYLKSLLLDMQFKNFEQKTIAKECLRIGYLAAFCEPYEQISIEENAK